MITTKLYEIITAASAWTILSIIILSVIISIVSYFIVYFIIQILIRLKNLKKETNTMEIFETVKEGLKIIISGFIIFLIISGIIVGITYIRFLIAR